MCVCEFVCVLCCLCICDFVFYLRDGSSVGLCVCAVVYLCVRLFVCTNMGLRAGLCRCVFMFVRTCPWSCGSECLCAVA